MWLKSIAKFIWLTLRPISHAEYSLGLVELINILPYALLVFLGIDNIRSWVATWWNEYWLIGIILTLILIAGVKLQYSLIPRIELVYINDREPYKTVQASYINPRNNQLQPERTSYKVGVRAL